MKFACISDTHGYLPDPALFDEADAIIHAGDIAIDMGQKAWYHDVFLPWCRKVSPPVYATFGNHDKPDNCLSLTYGLVPPNLHLHVNSEAELPGGILAWFSPYSLTFGGWSWMADEQRLATIFAQIPPETQVLVVHGPPLGYGDRCMDGRHAGSRSLLKAMDALPRLRAVITGHIHEARGSYAAGYREGHGPVTVLNVSCLDEYYGPLPNPITWLEL